MAGDGRTGKPLAEAAERRPKRHAAPHTAAGETAIHDGVASLAAATASLAQIASLARPDRDALKAELTQIKAAVRKIDSLLDEAGPYGARSHGGPQRGRRDLHHSTQLRLQSSGRPVSLPEPND